MKRLKDIFKRLGIQKKITLAVLLLVIIPMILANLLYSRKTGAFALDQMLESDKQVLALTGSNVSKITDQMISVSATICFDNRLTTILINKRLGESLSYTDMVTVNNILTNAQISLLDFSSIANLYDKNGERISPITTTNEATEDMTNQTDKIKKILQAQRQIIWIAPHTSPDSNKQNMYITLGRVANVFSKLKDKQIVLLVSIEEEQLRRRVFSDMHFQFEDENVLIVNHYGQIISDMSDTYAGEYISSEWLKSIRSSEKTGYFITDEQGSKYLISYIDIPHTDWKVIKVSDYNARVSRLTSVTKNNIIFMIFLLFIFFSVTIVISRRITAPIKKLQKQMENVDNTHLEKIELINGEIEVAQLGQSYNKMIERINVLIANIHLEQESKDRLRLELLQAQINPHFIYNSLNAIKWTAVINNAPNIAELVEDFGRIVAMSIKDIDRLIPLEKELENLNSYLKIQRLRYNYPLNVEIAPKDLEVVPLVPKLILQPIVENSIIHGFDPSYERALNIEVNIIMTSSSLRMTIKDDGVGIEKDKLDQILADLRLQTHKNQMDGIGLKNVHRRLQLLFGDEYGISITSVRTEGTTVTLEMPLIL